MSTAADMYPQGNNSLPATGSENNFVPCSFCHKLFKAQKFMEKHVKLKHSGVKETPKSDTELVPKQNTSCHESYLQETHYNDMRTTVNIPTEDNNEFTLKVNTDPGAEIKYEGNTEELNFEELIPEVKTGYDHVLDGVKKDDNQHNDNPSATCTSYVSCGICNKLFTSQQFLENHLAFKHKEKPKITGESSESKVNNGPMNINTIECRICGDEFDNIMEYTKHIEIHLYADESESQLNDGHEIKTEPRGERIQEEVYIKMNRCHDNSKPYTYTCTLCDKAFAYKCFLTRHAYAVHKIPKTFSCILCHKSFRENRFLRLHVDKFHKNIQNIKLFPCTFCGRLFTENGNLKTHVDTIHRKMKPFSCTLCHKSFARNEALIKHVNAVHRKLKPFSCTFCEKSFTSKQVLAMHIDSVHHKLKLFSCTMCNKSYGDKRNLISHMYAVHKSHKFLCNFCNKSFPWKCKLDKHIDAVHHKLKHFSCTLCEKSFGHQSNLIRHIKTSHKRIKPFS